MFKKSYCKPFENGYFRTLLAIAGNLTCEENFGHPMDVKFATIVTLPPAVHHGLA